MSDKVMNPNDHDVAPEERQLHRGIQAWHVSLIALGGIIGSCYFLGSGYTIAEVGPAAAFAYALGGLIIYAVMMSFGELLVNLPRRGSFVSYTREFIGESAAAGVGWSYWANWVAYCPAEALACGIMMNLFIPWSPFYWSIIFLGLITLINIYQVSWFGHIESVLALIKIGAVVVFSVCAVGIIFGLIGGEAVGFSVLLSKGEVSVYEALFPFGGFVVLTTMTMILVNFQGSEIIGLAAAETQNPEVNVPRACKAVTYRIIAIYVIPLLLLVMILPYVEAGLEDSVFSTALAKYGLNWAAAMFSIVTMIAAFSCANSGVYGTVRCLYGLAVEGLAPKVFMRLNRYNVPQFATIFTIAPMWIVLALGYYLPDSSLYAYLLSMSGFTGTICWMAIIAAQMVMRKKLTARGYDVQSTLAAKTPLYPVLPALGFLLMAFALFFLAWQPDLRPVLWFAVPATVGPAIAYKIAKSMGKTRTIKLAEDETLFDLKYPPINKLNA